MWVRTPTLEIGYEATGPADGTPVLLLHGFPYDVHAYSAVAPALAAAGCRVIVPYLRGYGPTRFLDAATPRSGQQAALGADVRDLMDALGIERCVLAGYDWGGRGACIVSALWPERVIGLVTAEGYNIQDIPGSVRPAAAEQEWRLWYQYYFHTARGEAGLRQNRRDVCRLLWRLWSPTWAFDEATFARSATAFDNPDWVDVVLQSYRHRFGYVSGDPALEPIEQALMVQPPITVPTVVLHGEDDGVAGPGVADDLRRFTVPVRHERIAGTGHNVPQEAPEVVVRAVLSLIARP
jgi:pimeloyl-ACP methyl ester carboxylesterase